MRWLRAPMPWLRTHSWLLWPVGLALFMHFLEFNGLLSGVEGLALSSRLLSGGARLSEVVYLVEIDEKDFKDKELFNDTSPLPEDWVWKLIKRVAKAEPAVIGVDILTDSDAWVRTSEDNLGNLEKGHHTRIVFIGGIAKKPKSTEQNILQWLLGRAEEIEVEPTKVLGRPVCELRVDTLWGLPIFPLDEDLRVRRYTRFATLTVRPDCMLGCMLGHRHSPYQPTFAKMIRDQYCESRAARQFPKLCQNTKKAEDPELIVNYSSSRSSFSKTPSRALLNDEMYNGFKDLFKHSVEGKIVLIGGTFSAGRDIYQTPHEWLSGLQINAFAVQNELENGGIREIWRPISFLVDVVFGLLIVGVWWTGKWTGNSIRWRIGNSLGLALLGVLVFSLLLYKRFDIWASYVGVVIGNLLHELVEVWRENPKSAE